MKFFARLEADGLAWSDRNLGSGARIATDTGFAWADIEDADTAQLDAVTGGEAFFQTFEYRVHCGFCLVARQARTVNDVMDDVLFNQRVHPLYARICLRIFRLPRMLETFSSIVNGQDVT